MKTKYTKRHPCWRALRIDIADPDGMLADGLGGYRSDPGGFPSGDPAMPVRRVSTGAVGSDHRHDRQWCALAFIYDLLGPRIHWELYHVARPLHAPSGPRTDSNASARNQLFRQCMSAAGWSEQTRSSPTTVEAPDTDWTRGFDVGLTGAQCAAPPSGTVNEYRVVAGLPERPERSMKATVPLDVS